MRSLRWILSVGALGLAVGCAQKGCSNPVETPQNDPSAFTNCNDPAQTSPPSSPLPDGGTLYCATDYEFCPYPGEGYQCGIEIAPVSCMTPPCPMGVAFGPADGGAIADGGGRRERPMRRHLDGGLGGAGTR